MFRDARAPIIITPRIKRMTSLAARCVAWSCSNEPAPRRRCHVLPSPKVSVIWEIIRDFFELQGSPIDVSFYSTYPLQVSALLNKTIDIAWNSPLAWLDSQRRSNNGCRAIAMRDTDRDRRSSSWRDRGRPFER